MPDVHRDVLVRDDRRLALRVRERAPGAGLAAEAADHLEHVVRELAELLRLLLVVLVGADVHVRSREHRVVARQVFRKERLQLRDNRVALIEVEVIRAVLLGRELRPRAREGERMRRDVDLGNDRHAHRRAVLHELAEGGLRVVSVLRRQLGIRRRLEAEGGLLRRPIRLRVLLDLVVVEMDVERIHLVIRHRLREVVEEVH